LQRIYAEVILLISFVRDRVSPARWRLVFLVLGRHDAPGSAFYQSFSEFAAKPGSIRFA
jgi:hypothetical protein